MNENQGATGQQIAELFELTPRRVQQLAKDGYLTKLGRDRYALVPCIRGMVRYWKERAEGRVEENAMETARRRKAEAEARQAELDLAEREERLLPLNVFDDLVAGAYDELRAKIVNFPGAVATQVVGLEDPRQALSILQPIGDGFLAAVSGLAETFEARSQAITDPLPDDFPGASKLREAAIESLAEVRHRLDEITQIKGIGPATAQRIRAQLVGDAEAA